MKPLWVGCSPRNYHAGRPASLAPRAIVLHRSGGSLAQIRARYADPQSSLSAHYAVGRDGSVEQYVSEDNSAFHAGIVANPSWPRLEPGVNPNLYTIAIDHESPAAIAWPDAQLAASAALIADVANRWSIEVGADTIVPHSAIRASSQCPGPGFPLQAILDIAEANPLVTTDEMELGGASDGSAPDGALAIDRTTLALAAEQYYPEDVNKDLIVLHFTAGRNASGAVDAWRKTPEHVATAYLVDPDGSVYEVFPPSAWAYHLGVKGGTPHERRSIGIEIANVGPLQPSAADPQVLSWWPDAFKKPYCRLDETNAYVNQNFRGMRYFAAFPGEQMDAVARLVHGLCARFDIPRQLPSAALRLSFDAQAFQGYKGVATHANFRSDKWDVGPAFEWDRLGL
jgi:N-acetyl-anhydromuramyl-L-alanine amidase AmpD